MSRFFLVHVILFLRLSSHATHASGWTQIGTLGDIESLGDSYLEDHELAIRLGSQLFQMAQIIINSWNIPSRNQTATFISFVDSFPCGDHVTSLPFCRVVLAKGLASNHSDQDHFYHYYYGYPSDEFIGGWGKLNGEETLLFSKPSNRFIQVGTLSDLMTLMDTYPRTTYEYGIKYNSILGSIHKITFSSGEANVGHIVSTT
eukprot:120726_1